MAYGRASIVADALDPGAFHLITGMDRVVIMNVSIGVKNLSKIYNGQGKQSTVALDRVSFEITGADVVCIVGPVGCGKTTLLRILAGLDDEFEGTVEIWGSNPNKSPIRTMVFQEKALFYWMTALENVAFGLKCKGISKRERLIKAYQLLESVGLADKVNAYPDELSGGQKQRVALARAFAVEPDIMCLDEPFGSQDYQTRCELQMRLLEMWNRRPNLTLFVTHDLEEAIFLGRKIIVMEEKGRIRQIEDLGYLGDRTQAFRSTSEFHETKRRLWELLKMMRKSS